MSEFKEFRSPFVLSNTPLSWAGSVPCLQLLLASIQWLWYLPPCRVPNLTQVPPSHVHGIDSAGIHTGTACRPHGIPQTWRKIPQPLPVFLMTKSGTTCLKLPNSVACWNWILASSFNYICISFFFLWMTSFVAYASL